MAIRSQKVNPFPERKAGLLSGLLDGFLHIRLSMSNVLALGKGDPVPPPSSGYVISKQELELAVTFRFSFSIRHPEGG